MITRIHISQPNIRYNRKHGTDLPVIGVRRYRPLQRSPGHCKTAALVEYARRADIVDDQGKIVATVHYRPDSPLECGAQVWIETTLNVEVASSPILR